VYDYVDKHDPVLLRMYEKRKRDTKTWAIGSRKRLDSGKAPYLSCCKRRVAKTARVAGDQRLITTPNNFSRDWPRGKIYVRNPRGCRNLMGGRILF
jgi:hypothetical protein